MKLLTIAAAGLMLAGPALAQDAAPAPAPAVAPEAAPPPPPPLETRELAPGVHLVTGDAGNIAVLSGPGGVLLVDAELPQGAPRVLAAVRTFSEAPLRYVIDTHWHMDHTGGNRSLNAAGALVVAHDAVRVRRSSDQFMPAYNNNVPAARFPESLPALTFNDTLTLHLNGETVRAFHAESAHTDGDVIVHFVNADVFHLGDIFFSGMFPFIDVDTGGGVQGVIAAVDKVIAASDENTIIVPAHGPVTDRKGLTAYRDMLVDVMKTVKTAVDSGQSLDAIRASKPAARYVAAGMEGDADAFVGFVYRSLTGAPHVPATPAAGG